MMNGKERKEISQRCWAEVGRAIVMQQTVGFQRNMRTAAQSSGGLPLIGEWSDSAEDPIPESLFFQQLQEITYRDQPLALEWTLTNFRFDSLPLRRQPAESNHSFAARVTHAVQTLTARHKRSLTALSDLPPSARVRFPSLQPVNGFFGIFLFLEGLGLTSSQYRVVNHHFMRFLSDLRRGVSCPRFAGIPVEGNLDWDFMFTHITEILEALNFDTGSPGPPISLNSTATLVFQKLLPLVEEMVAPPRQASSSLLRSAGLGGNDGGNRNEEKGGEGKGGHFPPRPEGKGQHQQQWQQSRQPPAPQNRQPLFQSRPPPNDGTRKPLPPSGGQHYTPTLGPEPVGQQPQMLAMQAVQNSFPPLPGSCVSGPPQPPTVYRPPFPHSQSGSGPPFDNRGGMGRGGQQPFAGQHNRGGGRNGQQGRGGKNGQQGGHNAGMPLGV
uniref:Uncharacterized protein n=1 Tax=Chromera velia CCMP2878 TaxID=1169474 RepID=A0A0G4HMT2_9ALVE|eukprot:Cvel_29195.t1-p1 / transcript=Cvel_29195.t1 / gene=Cvel_29195 / organism=Chromera_velia_CCMP2878 / gene_product=hypothetical protein / transcript_product=hypothetical protein / location=Cvel_scaffold3950:5866-7179(+) / protein_length=438 / sequence_SO=supercontig / SO=protein_coding / is_pseudo=false